MPMPPRIVIAAPASGSGKTTIATGLMAALSRSCRVQGFKVGPDYIDPGYHTIATGRVSRNLDTWMVAAEQVKRTFARAVAGADIAIVEGVMGLFDGYDALTENGSTAQVAKLLQAPVVLVLDVGRMARSAGALALGYRDYDPALQVAGVICNNVGSPKHAEWVTQAIEAIGLPVLGCLPRDEHLHVPERHLGLQTALERQTELAGFLDHAAACITQHIDLERLVTIAQQAPAWTLSPPVPLTENHALDAVTLNAVRPPVRIAVARDTAFCFYYEDNFDLLRAAGAEIVPFSPLHDAALPDAVAGLYLGGGYPELYAAQLTANRPMLDALRAAIRAGVPTVAECGGLMVLTQSITDLTGDVHPMLGIVPGQAHMQSRLTMGYRQITARSDNLLLRQGEQTRGHEFHYSDWVTDPASALPYAYNIAPRTGTAQRPEGYAQGNVLASYVHLHFGAHAALAGRLVNACRTWQAMQVGR